MIEYTKKRDWLQGKPVTAEGILPQYYASATQDADINKVFISDDISNKYGHYLDDVILDYDNYKLSAYGFLLLNEDELNLPDEDQFNLINERADKLTDQKVFDYLKRADEINSYFEENSVFARPLRSKGGMVDVAAHGISEFTEGLISMGKLAPMGSEYLANQNMIAMMEINIDKNPNSNRSLSYYSLKSAFQEAEKAQSFLDATDVVNNANTLFSDFSWDKLKSSAGLLLDQSVLAELPADYTHEKYPDIRRKAEIAATTNNFATARKRYYDFIDGYNHNIAAATIRETALSATSKLESAASWVDLVGGVDPETQEQLGFQVVSVGTQFAGLMGASTIGKSFARRIPTKKLKQSVESLNTKAFNELNVIARKNKSAQSPAIDKAIAQGNFIDATNKVIRNAEQRAARRIQTGKPLSIDEFEELTTLVRDVKTLQSNYTLQSIVTTARKAASQKVPEVAYVSGLLVDEAMQDVSITDSMMTRNDRLELAAMYAIPAYFAERIPFDVIMGNKVPQLLSKIKLSNLRKTNPQPTAVVDKTKSFFEIGKTLKNTGLVLTSTSVNAFTEGLAEHSQGVFLDALISKLETGQISVTDTTGMISALGEGAVEISRDIYKTISSDEYTVRDFYNDYTEFVIGALAGGTIGGLKSTVSVLEKSRIAEDVEPYLTQTNAGIAAMASAGSQTKINRELYTPEFNRGKYADDNEYQNVENFLDNKNREVTEDVLKQQIQQNINVAMTPDTEIVLKDGTPLEVSFIDDSIIRTYDPKTKTEVVYTRPEYLKLLSDNDIQFKLNFEAQPVISVSITDQQFNDAVSSFESTVGFPVVAEMVTANNRIFKGEKALAAFDNKTGKVYINVDAVDSPAALQKLLQHEVIGHGVLKSALTPTEFTELFNLARTSYPDLYDTISQNYDNLSDSKLMEEFLANIAEDVDLRQQSVAKRILKVLVDAFNRVFNTNAYNQQQVRDIIRDAALNREFSHRKNTFRAISNYMNFNQNADFAVFTLADNNIINLTGIKQLSSEQILKDTKIDIKELNSRVMYISDVGNQNTVQDYLIEVYPELAAKPLTLEHLSITQQELEMYSQMLNYDYNNFESVAKSLFNDIAAEPPLSEVEFKKLIDGDNVNDKIGAATHQLGSAINTAGTSFLMIANKIPQFGETFLQQFSKAERLSKKFFAETVENTDITGIEKVQDINRIASSHGLEAYSDDFVILTDKVVGRRLLKKYENVEVNTFNKYAYEYGDKKDVIKNLLIEKLQTVGYDPTETYTIEQLHLFYFELAKAENIIKESDYDASITPLRHIYRERLANKAMWNSERVTEKMIEKLVQSMEGVSRNDKRKISDALTTYYQSQVANSFTKFVTTTNSLMLTSGWYTTLAQLQDIPLGLQLGSLNLGNATQYFKGLVTKPDEATMAEYAGVTLSEQQYLEEANEYLNSFRNKLGAITGLRMASNRLLSAKLQLAKSEIFKFDETSPSWQDMNLVAKNTLSEAEYNKFIQDVKSKTMSEEVKSVISYYQDMTSAESRLGKSLVYYKGGYWPILYNLKGFMVPVFSTLRRRIVYNMQQANAQHNLSKDTTLSKEQRDFHTNQRNAHMKMVGREITKITVLQMAFGWTRFLSDILKGYEDDDDEDFMDYALESGLAAFGISKYQIMTAQREGVWQSAVDLVSPAFVLGDTVQEILTGQASKRNLNSMVITNNFKFLWNTLPQDDE